jgi:type IV pilus assembly protein PilB
MGEGIRRIIVSKLDSSLAERLPKAVAEEFSILPVHFGKDKLTVLTPEGRKDSAWLAEIQEQIGFKVMPYGRDSFKAEEIQEAIKEFYGARTKRLGELLLRHRLITESQLSEALTQQKADPKKKIGVILCDLGYVNERDVQRIYAEQIGYQYLSVNASFFMDISLVEKLPAELVRSKRILPIPKNDSENEIFLLSTEKLSESLIGEIKSHLGVKKVEPVLTATQDMEAAIDGCFKRLEKMRSREKNLGEILLERNLITKAQLDYAVREQKKRHIKLGEVLVASGAIEENIMLQVISERLGIEYLQYLPPAIPSQFTSLLTEKFAVYNKLVPISREGEKLVVAMSDPQDKNLLELLVQALKSEVRPVLAGRREIERAIRQLFHGGAEESQERIDLKRPVELSVVEYSDVQAGSKRIINLVNNILVEGVERNASDIHITPKENTIKLSYRIDGDLVPMADLPIADRDNIITRIKIMGDMRIDARHIPQSGRIVARIDKRHIDFRISTLPTQHGENVVMRILDSNRLLDSNFDRLGLPPEVKEGFLEQCERSQGIILVTGPTGSGKTTTLYHALNWLRNRFPNKSISTIENPIEYVLDGIIQSEINEPRGLTYAAVLKEKLRQDPDVIMVGEIRNLEEAQLAFTAALTGHTVLSTLHTNDGPTTLRRLVEMGMEPYNVSTAICCVLSQRLLKRICRECKTDYAPTPKDIEIIRRSYPDFDPAEHSLKTGRGCRLCHKGYSGRIGAYELILVNLEVKQLISRNVTDTEIRNAAVASGMKTLRMAALDLAFQGITTLEEVFTATDIVL